MFTAAVVIAFFGGGLSATLAIYGRRLAWVATVAATAIACAAIYHYAM